MSQFVMEATQTLDAGSGHTNYLWSTGATTQTIDVSTSGTYSVTVGNGTPVNNSNSLSFDGTDDYVDLIICNKFIRRFIYDVVKT